jgi:hypothetical protein
MGTPSDDEILGVVIDSSGNIYTTGYQHGVVGITNVPPAGDAKMVVMKHAPTGELVWTAGLQTNGTDVGEGLVISPDDGNIYAVGRTDGAFDGFMNKGQFDLVVAAVSPEGEVLGIHQGGDERPQHPRRIAFDRYGDILIAGYDDTYVPNVAVVDWENSLFVKLGVESACSFSELLWLRSKSQQPDYLTSLAVGRDSKPDMYATGFAANGMGSSVFVQSFDVQGMSGWGTVVSKISVDAANAVALSPSGDLYVAGATFLTLGDSSYGQQDAFLLKIDRSTGEIVWAAQAGSSESDWPTSIGFDSDGNIFVAGETLGSFPGFQNQGLEDLFALKFDSAGALLGVWQSGTPGEEHVGDMAVDACGGVILGGYTSGDLASDQSSAGGRDMFLLRVPM